MTITTRIRLSASSLISRQLGRSFRGVIIAGILALICAGLTVALGQGYIGKLIATLGYVFFLTGLFIALTMYGIERGSQEIAVNTVCLFSPKDEPWEINEVKEHISETVDRGSAFILDIAVSFNKFNTCSPKS